MQRIDIFPWDDNFETGIEHIDAQHQRLVEIINELATQFSFSPENIDITTVFDDLLAYTDYHFSHEEAIWKEYLHNEKSEIEHRKSHADFLQTLHKLIQEQQEKDVEKVAENTLNILVKWLVSHILQTDRYMAYWVLAIQEGYTHEGAKDIAQKKMGGQTRTMIGVVMRMYSLLSQNTLRLMHELDIQHKMKTELKLHDELLHTVINEMPDILFLKDHQAKFLLANKTLANLYGTTPEEMVGKDDGDFGVPKELNDFFRENVLSIMKQNQTQIVYEDSRDAKTGEIHHYKSIKKPLKDAKGNSQILGIAHDITEQKALLDQLQLEKKRYKYLMKNASDGIIIFNGQDQIVEYSARAREMLGYSDAEMYELKVFDFDDLYSKEDIEQMQQTVQLEPINFETRHRRKDGTTYAASVSSSVIELDGEILVYSSFRDITELIDARQKIEASRDRLQLILQTTHDAFVIADMEGNIVEVNNASCTLLQYSREEMLQLNLIDIDAILSKEEIIEKTMRVFESGSATFETKHKRKDTTVIDVEVSVTYIEQQKVFISFIRDISDRKRYQKQLEYIAHYDALTGLPNRLLLSDRIEQAIFQSKRNGKMVAVAYLDIDGFKNINDKYGHDVGDQLLITISKQMKEVLRESDTLSRLGGDEFVAVLPGIEDIKAVTLIVKRLLEAASKSMLIDDKLLHVSASIGVTYYPQDDSVDSDKLIRQGDQAMYLAKQAGKNRYYVFDPEYDRSMRSHHKDLERIRLALEQDEFVLHYQPKVNMRTGEVIGVEALIRWEHPQEGLLLPGHFLPLVDKHPLIIKIGDWVLESVMQQITQWHKAGIHIPVSINIHAMQMEQSDFIDKLEAILYQYAQIQKGDLEFEILESSALEDIANVVEIISRCQEFGISFSLDDFGTGYSSLTYLKKLPVEVLKIDRSFVMDMLDDTEDLAIVKGVLELASTFNRKVLAEGVENVRQGLILLLLGCDMAQGYVIAKPMASKELVDWLEHWQTPKEWLGIAPIDSHDIAWVYAIVESRKWIHKIKNCLHGNCMDFPTLDADECQFGKWLQHVDHEIPVFEEIELLHNELHLQVQRIVHRFNKGQNTFIDEDIMKLKSISEDFETRLMSLLHQMTH